MYRIAKKRVLNPTVTMMDISAPLVAAKGRAGQFIILRVDGDGERIPLTIAGCDRQKGTVRIIFQVVGATTMALNSKAEGDFIQDFVGPLGEPSHTAGLHKVAVVGGGFGVAPLLSATRACKAAGAEVRIYNGFATAERIMLTGLFAEAGKLTVCTDDGSTGFRGFPTAALEADIAAGWTPDVILCCGPSPLMRVVKKLGEERGIVTYLSLEQRMGCGIGACLTCTCKVAGHNKRVCKDGPVFISTEVQP